MKEAVVYLVNRKQIWFPLLKLALVNFDALKISRKLTGIRNCIFLNLILVRERFFTSQ